MIILRSDNMYKMIITSKYSSSILHIEEHIKRSDIDKYVNWFFNHSLQNYADYRFEKEVI